LLFLEDCFNYITNAKSKNSNILVHCDGGVNRAPTIVVGYLISREKWTLEKAYKHVQLLRPKIAPRKTYFEQLQKLEQSIHGSISLQLADIGPPYEERMKEALKKVLNNHNNNNTSIFFSGSFSGTNPNRLQNLINVGKQSEKVDVVDDGKYTEKPTGKDKQNDQTKKETEVKQDAISTDSNDKSQKRNREKAEKVEKTEDIPEKSPWNGKRKSLIAIFPFGTTTDTETKKKDQRNS